MRSPGDASTGTGGTPRRGLLLAVQALLVAMLVLGTGCSNRFSRPKDEGDILKGDYKFNRVSEPEKPQQVKSDVPPLPEYRASLSTAAMAAALPLQGARPLNIPDEQALTAKNTAKPNPVPAMNSGNWQGQPTAGTSNGKPSLGPPQPITLPESKPVTPVTAQETPAAPVAPAVPTYAELQHELKKRGVLWQREEKAAAGIRFICAVPHPLNPKAERVYEVIAADSVTAMQAVLEKLARP
jgi:hypothetical protein